MKRMLLALTILLLAAIPAGCGGSTSKTFTEADAGKTVVVKPGESFNIVLEANPTTGYTWEVAPDSRAPVALQGEPAFKPDSSAIGSGGQMTLTFKAGEAGQGALLLLYHQPWDQTAPPAATFEINVTVQ